MKRLFVLLALTSGGLAQQPYQSRKDGFSVHFHHAPAPPKSDGSATTYTWDSPESEHQGEAVLVFAPLVAPDRAALKAVIAKELGLRPFGEQKPFQLDGYQGEEWNGLSPHGTPMVLRLMTTPRGGYVWAASSFETARNWEFVRSFRLAHP